MYKLCSLLLLLACSTATFAQSFGVKGYVTDTAGKPVGSASIALLQPSDSTMAAFGVSNSSGYFEVKGAARGEYLLQVAMMGYYTSYRKVTLPLGNDGSAGMIALQENPSALGEVIVSGEKIPIRIKGDTVEYNAGSFKVKPNAAVEDLLRQLPGVEVDRDGNIKSQGKDVKKVLVDGKEFFGDDPKIATKNLPADAISKVQTFDKRSDQSLFTGIDDGERDQTINLMLKDGKKTGHFGELKAGGGTDSRYEASAKVYQFRKKTQMAALGTLNNINEFGFSMRDYIDLKGGLSSLLGSGGQFALNSDDMPVNFGQPTTGNITSGAVGLNYSWEPRTNNRFNISYIGNGADKELDQNTNTQNFTPGSTFIRDDRQREVTAGRNHSLAARWRNDIDSFHQVTWTGNAGFKTSHTDRNAITESWRDELLQNRLRSDATTNGHFYNAATTLGYTQKLKGNWPVFRANAGFSYERGLSETEWTNFTEFFDPVTSLTDRQFQDNTAEKVKGNAGTFLVRSLGKGLYLEPGISGAYDRDLIRRRQGALPEGGSVFDSLSPDFYRNAWSATPQLSLRKSNQKTQWSINIGYESTWMTPVINNLAGSTGLYQYWTPSLFWQRSLGLGRLINFSYRTDVRLPTANQLLPVLNIANPLERMTGNSTLRPEYVHNANVHYSRFDQFSMSSLFAYLNMSYTTDKINWDRTINPDLSQDLRLVNTGYQADVTGQVSAGKPLRSLGVGVNATLQEMMARAVSPVNGVDNINTTWTHELELSIDNRKKDRWDVNVGGKINISDSRYSLNKQLNNTYYNYTGFAQLSYRPDDHWYFTVSMDLTHYTARSFNEPVTIPLLKAEVSRTFLKNDRGMLTLKGFDLLDRNTYVQRVSQLNYLMDQRSNTIGRYLMLSFSYRLNKAGNAPGAGTTIRIK